MQTLTLPSGFPFPDIGTEISPKDTMFDGRASHYLSVGLSAIQAIEAAMGDSPVPRHILDLPSGHGRVTRALRARFATALITCCDVDHEGALFAARQFGARAVLSSGTFQELDLGDRFDLIWVGSLLTHLSERHARQFLDCLVRHMAPDAFLVMSSHGAYVADRMLSWDYGLGLARARCVVEEHRATGYGFRDYPGGEGYGVSLISRQWIENALQGSPLRLTGYTERGWDDHQDIVVLRLTEEAARSRRSPARLLRQAHAALASRWPGRTSPTDWFEARYSPAPAEKGAAMSTTTDVLDEFDEAWYLTAYPDVAEAVRAEHFASAFEHYRSHGKREGRLPRAQEAATPSGKAAEAADGAVGFDEAAYLEANPDVAESVRNGTLTSGYAHWMASGRAEGRIPPSGYTEGVTFDAEWYAASYHAAAPEIASGRVKDAEEHYQQIGRARGYLPNRYAPRPDNPAGTPSRFGGLWLDHANALDLIQGRLELSEIDEQQAELLQHWVRHGYVILRGAVPEDVIVAAADALVDAYEGRTPGVKFECAAVGGYKPMAWDPAVCTHPAKALDLHWWSPGIRDLIFAPNVRQMLELLFGRRALATQSLSFLRGSAQGYHQDTLYVPYTLPTQFAASWIALEDVTAGAGELMYIEGSHRLPDFLYGGQYKTLWDAQRMVRKGELRAEMQDYSANLERRSKEAGLRSTTFLARRGDVLLWHADLVHGGLPISPDTTRKSVVTHYCPREVAPMTFERGRTSMRNYEGIAWYATGYYDH